MKTIRTVYQALIPFRLREAIFRVRSTAAHALLPERVQIPQSIPAITPVEEVPPWIVTPTSPPPVRNIPEIVKPLLEEMRPLPGYWHEAGTLSIDVLEAIAHYLGMGLYPIKHSMETACGKSTILLSHLSTNHKVFTLTTADNSFTTVMNFPHTKRDVLEVIEGPSQLTLPAYRFADKLQFALIDGPHGYPFPDLEYYFIYPHLEQGAILVVDDIHIPNIKNMFNFLCAEEMFTLLEVVSTTAIFRRTEAPTFDPLGDGWWKQGFNHSVAAAYLKVYPSILR